MANESEPFPPDFRELISHISEGDDLALSRLITHIENRDAGYQAALSELWNQTGDAHTIGITGPPGAGKSTIVDTLVRRYRNRDLSVGVVAVDPASPYSGGSILGDRIRQRALLNDDEVFFRSMSARNQSGGLAPATVDVVRALDAAGKDVIIVETVGSGQSEIEVVKATDTVCVVLFPGAGDDVQANKAGLLEIADVFAVNKADVDGAEAIVHSLQEMLELGDTSNWTPPITKTIATEEVGIEALSSAIEDHWTYLQTDDRLDRRRQAQFSHQVELLARERVLGQLAKQLNTREESCKGDSAHKIAEEIVAAFSPE